MKCPSLTDESTILGAIGHFVSKYRNPSSHPPQSAKDVYAKYLECKEAFMSALGLICDLKNAMKNKNIQIKAKNI